jgi:hypothetical protein
MALEWRLNPPPNWPLAQGIEVGLDWQPDPSWGPPPVGWQLWERRLRLPRIPLLNRPDRVPVEKSSAR